VQKASGTLALLCRTAKMMKKEDPLILIQNDEKRGLTPVPMDCSGHCPPLWDGKTAARIVEAFCI